MGFNRYHFGLDAIVEFAVNIFQISCFTAAAGTVINDLYLNFPFF